LAGGDDWEDWLLDDEEVLVEDGVEPLLCGLVPVVCGGVGADD
jgi:hypothetical protein